MVLDDIAHSDYLGKGVEHLGLTCRALTLTLFCIEG